MFFICRSGARSHFGGARRWQRRVIRTVAMLRTVSRALSSAQQRERGRPAGRPPVCPGSRLEGRSVVALLVWANGRVPRGHPSCGRRSKQVRGTRLCKPSQSGAIFSAPERTARARQASSLSPLLRFRTTPPVRSARAPRFAPRCAPVWATTSTRSWFNALEFDEFDGKTVKVSVPVVFPSQVDPVALSRSSCWHAAAGPSSRRLKMSRFSFASRAARRAASCARAGRAGQADARSVGRIAPDGRFRVGPSRSYSPSVAGRTSVDGFEGSPLDPHHTFENFVVGASEPHGLRRRDPGRRNRADGQPRLQPALSLFVGRHGQDPSPPGHRLGSEAPRAERAGALSHRRALPLSVRRGAARAGRVVVQGEVPLDQPAAHRRSRVHAGREDRAGVRPHHQRAAGWRPSDRRRLGAPSRADRSPQRAHALAASARSRR